MAKPYEYTPPTLEQTMQYGIGPWNEELDQQEWQHLGYDCCILRQPSLGHLCGYVRIPEWHPWEDASIAEQHVQCHGGVTYYSRDWIGFDCGHWYDLSPRYAARHGARADKVYRTFAYVKLEVHRIVKQLHHVAQLERVMGGV